MRHSDLDSCADVLDALEMPTAIPEITLPRVTTPPPAYSPRAPVGHISILTTQRPPLPRPPIPRPHLDIEAARALATPLRRALTSEQTRNKPAWIRSSSDTDDESRCGLCVFCTVAVIVTIVVAVVLSR
jgi:hypothetical protein